MDACRSLQVGWQRDVTTEGIEPNPGPTLTEVIDYIAQKVDTDNSVLQNLMRLASDVRTENPGNPFLTAQHLVSYIKLYPDRLNSLFGSSATGLLTLSLEIAERETALEKNANDIRLQDLQDQLEETKKKLMEEKQRAEEYRVGRTRAERELRRYVNEHLQRSVSQSGESKEGNLAPIGYIECCFRERNGTPRQGTLVPNGRGILRLRLPLMDASHTLEGLDQYSHIWIIFIFHENTNVLRGLRKDRVSSVVKAKVKPPRLDGRKVGLFSTRTPHRPNPIGLSIAKVDKIEGPVVYLSGIDLIDGTPVLDIKPYIPQYDSLPHVLVPDWTYDAPVPSLQAVTFELGTEESLQKLVPSMRFYNSYEDIRSAIEQVLILDIRSIRRRKTDKVRESNSTNVSISENRNEKDENQPEQHRFAIDVLNVVFIVVHNVAHIIAVELDKELPINWYNNM